MAEKDDYLLDLLVDLGFTNRRAGRQSPHGGASRRHWRGGSTGGQPGHPARLMSRRPRRRSSARKSSISATRKSRTTSFPSFRATSPKNIASSRVFKTEGKVAVAIADPSDLNTIDSLHHLLNAEIEYRVASEPDIDAALNKYYGGEKKSDRRRARSRMSSRS